MRIKTPERGFDLLEIVSAVLRAIKGKELVVTRWKGKTYLRKYRKPKNPRTEKQQMQRNKFTNAVEAWHKLTNEERKKYRKEAEDMQINGFNLFVSRYLKDS